MRFLPNWNKNVCIFLVYRTVSICHCYMEATVIALWKTCWWRSPGSCKGQPTYLLWFILPFRCPLWTPNFRPWPHKRQYSAHPFTVALVVDGWNKTFTVPSPTPAAQRFTYLIISDTSLNWKCFASRSSTSQWRGEDVTEARRDNPISHSSSVSIEWYGV